MKIVPYILGAALVAMCWMYCNQAKDFKAIEADRNLVADSNRILKSSQNALLIRNDSLTKVSSLKDSVFHHAMDSMNTRIAEGRLKLQSLSNKISGLLSQVQAIANASGDSVLKSELDMTKDAFTDAQLQVMYLQSLGDQKDSIINVELNRKDSLIAAKDNIIKNLAENFDGAQALIDKLQKDLDTAIHSRKKSNIIRTAGEVLGGLLLIFSLK